MPANLTIGEIWIDVSISERHALSADVTEHPVEQGSAIADHIRPKPRELTIEGLVTNHPTEPPLSHAGGATGHEDAGYIDVTTVPGRRVPPMTVEILGEPTDYGLGPIPGVGQAIALGGVIAGALGLPSTLPRRRFAAEHHVEDTSGRTFHAVTALAFSTDFDRVGAVYRALVDAVEAGQPVQLVTGLDIYDQVALCDLAFDRSADVGPHALRFTAGARVLRIVSAQTARVPKPLEPRGKPGQSRGKQTTAPTPSETLPPPAQDQVGAALSREDRSFLFGFIKSIGGARP